MSIEAMKLALEALETYHGYMEPLLTVFGGPRVPAEKSTTYKVEKAITAIKETLAVDKESLTTEARHMPSNDALYKAWNLIGADLAGLKFEDFVRHLSAQQNAERVSNEQVEPVAWRYKPAHENNPRWEYTTEHPLDMGDGYLRPSLVEYCKCIEPLYAKEKPKLMLEKFREMKDLLNDTHPPVPTAQPKEPETITVQEAWEACGGNAGIKASKDGLIAALKSLDTVCDEADSAQPEQEPKCIGKAWAMWGGPVVFDPPLTQTEQRKPLTEWQPIETAPTTGRELILLLTPSKFPQVAYTNSWWTTGFSVENKPTHWMPIPPIEAAHNIKE